MHTQQHYFPPQTFGVVQTMSQWSLGPAMDPHHPLEPTHISYNGSPSSAAAMDYHCTWYSSLVPLTAWQTFAHVPFPFLVTFFLQEINTCFPIHPLWTLAHLMPKTSLLESPVAEPPPQTPPGTAGPHSPTASTPTQNCNILMTPSYYSKSSPIITIGESKVAQWEMPYEPLGRCWPTWASTTPGSCHLVN